MAVVQTLASLPQESPTYIAIGKRKRTKAPKAKPKQVKGAPRGNSVQRNR
jgi:hypothetical protein